jgi:hypothetical protein
VQTINTQFILYQFIVVATVAENVLGDLNAITSFNPDREKQC